ncbi:MAG: hypothetical protein EFKGCFLK_01041 [Rhodocyclaceae bacterium]|nr:hypothetical protein [Rhodocyclaceae bacterium]
MLLGEVAEEDRALLARGQAFGDGLRRCGGLHAGERRIDGHALDFSHSLDDAGEFHCQRRRCDDGLGVQVDQLVVVGDVQQADAGELLRRLAQALGQQRMVLAQEAADDQHAIQHGNLGNRHAQPGRDALAVEGKVSLAETAVDVLAAGAAHEFLQQVEFFQRRMRRGQRAKRSGAMLAHHALQIGADEFQRRLPVHLAPFAALLEHRLG